MTTPYTCLRPHSSTTAGYGRRRHGDDRQVDLLGEVEDAGDGPDASDVLGVRVDRPDRAHEARLAAGSPSASWPTVPGSRPAPITATLRGDSSRRTASAAADRARASMAASASGVGWSPRRTSTTPSANLVAVSKPAWVKTPIILRFSGQDRGGEPRQAHLASAHREVLEQHRGQPPAVVGVVDEEGHLGLGAVPPPVVARDADELVRRAARRARTGRRSRGGSCARGRARTTAAAG